MNQIRHSATSRVTTGRANMAGPMIGGKAGWINPFGFFVSWHFLPISSAPTQPCKAGIPQSRVNHARVRARGLCSARSNHAKDRTWSSDRERNDCCRTKGLSLVRKSAWKNGLPAKMAEPMPARNGRGVGFTHRQEYRRGMKLTHENLHALGTNGAGWNKKQLEILGISWPPKNGWLKKLIGTEIEEEKYQQLLDFRGAKRTKRGNYRLSGVQPELIILSQERPICSKCGKNNVYAQGGPHMDWCEPCLWESVKNDSNH